MRPSNLPIIASLAFLSASINAHAQGMPPGSVSRFPPGVFQSRAALDAAPSGSCSQATAFLARVTTSNSAAVTAMICGMVTDGTWADFDVLYVASDSAATMLTNLISSSYPATANSSPTFTSNTGYTFSGSANLSSTYNVSTATNFKQNNAFEMSWQLPASCLNTYSLGDAAEANDYNILPCFASSADGYLNGGTQAGGFSVTSNGSGLIAFERVTGTSNQIKGYQNGSSIGSTTSTAVAPANTTLLIGNSALGAYTANIAVIGFGGGLQAAGQASAYARIHTYLHTINPTSFP